jgi:hypothetical protein
MLGEIRMDTFNENELEDILYTQREDVIKSIKNSVEELVRDHPFICFSFVFALGVAVGTILSEGSKEY